MSRTSYRAALIGVGFGTLFGVALLHMWEQLTYPKEIYLQQISAFIRYVGLHEIPLDTFTKEHVVAGGLFLALSGTLLLGGLALVCRLVINYFIRPAMTYFTPPDPLDSLLGGTTDVRILVSRLRSPTYTRLGTEEQLTLPDNSFVLPDSIAIAELYSEIRKRYGTHRRLPRPEHSYSSDMRDSHLIVLGGPYVNEVAHYIFDNKLVPHFAITDTFGCVDDNVHYDAVVEVKSSRTVLTRDYGFIVCLPNPYNPTGLRACLIFGLYPQGTLAAVRVLVDPFFAGDRHGVKQRRSYAKQFVSHIRRGRNCVAIVEVAVDPASPLLGECNFVKVRTFDSSRRALIRDIPADHVGFL
jgi:hypothetical protein